MKFFCTRCGQKLAVQTMHSVEQVRCPSCGHGQVPTQTPIPPSSPVVALQAESWLRAVTPVTDGAQEKAGQGLREIPETGGPGHARSGDGAARPAASPISRILASERAARYQVGGVVARGGMGAILNATDANILRNVAMKVMLDPQAVDEDTLLRFVQEAQVTGQLEHPNIVPVHELGVDSSGNVFYTMKFVRGVTLDGVLAKLRNADAIAAIDYPLVKLLNIFQKVCDAIAFAHSRNVIHRDLKPENIMIGDYGEVLVMDWGLAKVVEKRGGRAKKQFVLKGRVADPRPVPKDNGVKSLREDAEFGKVLKTMSGAIMGTPGFMAPEQAAGDIEQMDERADIYSLGAILYDILTLEPPVKGKTLDEVLRKVSSGQIEEPTTFNPKSRKRPPGAGTQVLPRESSGQGSSATVGRLPHLPEGLVPESLSAVAMKALSVDPSRRYPSVQALQKEIEAYQGGFATAAEHASTWRQVQLFFRRHRTVAILGSLAAVGVIGGGIVSTVQWVSAAKERNNAREALAALKGTAPALIAQARSYIEQGDVSNAVNQAKYAAELMQTSPEYQVIKGDMLECALRIEEAAASYERALALISRDGDGSGDRSMEQRTRENLALCRKILGESKGGKLSPAAVTELHVAMRKQDRFSESLLMLRSLGTNVSDVASMYKAVLDKRGVKYRRLSADSVGRCNLDLSGSNLTDLRVLQGIPLAALNLTGCPVSDLTPLKGMALNEINISFCPKIADISQLRGLPLEGFSAQSSMDGSGGATFADLAPLKGMRLKNLDIAFNRRVSDLSPLAGMPLVTMNLAGCSKLTDFSPLKGMKTLTTITGEPWPVLSPVFMNQVRAKDKAGAETEARRLVADWSDVPAMASVAARALAYLDLVKAFSTPASDRSTLLRQFGGHRYYVYPSPTPWDDAKVLCEMHGAHLMTITTREELDFITEAIKEVGTGGSHYVGLQLRNNSPAWVTGEPWVENKWCPVTMRNGPAAALVLGFSTKERTACFWFTFSSFPFVIEWDD